MAAKKKIKQELDFQAFYDRWHRYIYKQALRYNFPEDVVQETWICLLVNDKRGIRNFKGNAKKQMFAYLRRFVHNAAIAFNNKKMKDRFAEYEHNSTNESVTDPCYELDNDSCIDLEIFFRTFANRKYQNTGTRDVAIFEKYFLQGYTTAEIAEMGLTKTRKTAQNVVAKMGVKVRTFLS